MNAVNENIYINLASHAIGLDHKKPYKRHKKYFYRPYRNYYDAPKDCEVWEMMATAGYADTLQDTYDRGFEGGKKVKE